MTTGSVARPAAPAGPAQPTAVVEALPSLAALEAAAPLSALRAQVTAQRRQTRAVLDGHDDRLMVIVGPCSVHDPAAGLEYAARLAEAARAYRDDLFVVLRAYLEKPRSVLGWRGLVPDPGLDGGGDLTRGLVLGRRFLADAAGHGLPLATEFVDPMLAPLLADAISWGSVGARTVHSQPHRALAAGLPMPVGFKNALDGDVGAAVDAVRAAAAIHVYPALDADGAAVIVRAAGNRDGHVVLRGGAHGPNHDAHSVSMAQDLLRAAGLPVRLVVDASHGNSGKDYRRQPAVVGDLADQVGAGDRGLVGVMIESFLVGGRQERPDRYGVSITDGCLGWDDTAAALRVLAAAARSRR
ncbi:3-deoxy-7-phosphoheptulonate synthase [Pilimelia columellifera]|uniref:Phospho-2-dehydro-3-deoxyheptonate aldolase n=1 Tax=Pilimelia columellifera subsp. columellifera TaxID=706583 RepID=A0ABP6AAC7_9ACTN